MVQSKATTVQEYLDELPAERRAVVAAVRKVILKNLPNGYQEAMNWGVINYQVPLERLPNTYNGQPLSYVALAAQKNHYAIYLMSAYGCAEKEARLKAAYAKLGKKMDMGKACLRFKKLEDLPLDLIGELVSETPMDAYIAAYEAIRRK